jgi:hypothetical protein
LHQLCPQTGRTAAAAPKTSLEGSCAADPGSEYQQQLDHVGIHADILVPDSFGTSTGRAENIASIRALISSVLIAARGDEYEGIVVDFNAVMCGFLCLVVEFGCAGERLDHVSGDTDARGDEDRDECAQCKRPGQYEGGCGARQRGTEGDGRSRSEPRVRQLVRKWFPDG